MKKKKVLFIMPSMFIGGAERSLIGLLESFDYSAYDVKLFLYRHEGEFIDYIPKKVHLLPENKKYGTFDVPIRDLLFSSRWLFGCARILSKIAGSIHSKIKHEPKGIWMLMQYTSRFLIPLLPKIPGQYDLAIMFLGIGDVLAKKVDAKRKVTWNHTDYATICPDKRYDISVFNKIDFIASVSKLCTEQFLRIYPQMLGKAITIENIISQDLLQMQANDETNEYDEHSNCTKLLSVGRFTEQKNFDNVPFICKSLIEKGIDVKWYIIGYGSDEEFIKGKIAEAKMEDNVIMLGKKTNPYPYMKNCDIYVQPSRYEGKCVAVREAQILNKPVIITNYATAASQLIDGYDGIIVPMDNEGCANGIARVIADRSLQRSLIENTKKSDYTNSREVEKIYSMIEEAE